MLELDADNAGDYLQKTGFVQSPPKVTELSGGVSNIVLRVETTHGIFVLKQSRPQLRTKDPWFSDISRIYREIDAIRALQPFLPSYMPEVVHEDRQQYLFIMTAAPREAVTWKQQLLQGRAEPAKAELAGRLLATIHQHGFRNALFQQQFGDTTNFYQLRLEPYYIRLRNRFPDLRTFLNALIHRAEHTSQTVVHADFSPKNILVTDETFTLVDFETVHFGDPTFDLGFFLAHLTLKSIYHQDRFEEYRNLIERFWNSYLEAVDFESQKALVQWGLQHLAANLLVRIDGTSPVDYLNDDRHRETGRQYAHRLFHSNWHQFQQALDALESVIKSGRMKSGDVRH